MGNPQPGSTSFTIEWLGHTPSKPGSSLAVKKMEFENLVVPGSLLEDVPKIIGKILEERRFATACDNG